MKGVETKAFVANRQYRIGRARETRNKMNLTWQAKPKSLIYSGQQLITAGTPTAAEYWQKNPFDFPTRIILTIAEIEPTTQEEIIFDTGTHYDKPKVDGLSDVPTATPPQSDRLSQQAVRVYEERVGDLKAQVATLQGEVESLRKRLDKERNEADARERELERALARVKDEAREAKLEIKYINEHVLPKSRGLGDEADRASMAQQTAPFQEALAKYAVDKVAEFFGGGRGRTPAPAPAGAETNHVTSDDLGIPPV